MREGLHFPVCATRGPLPPGTARPAVLVLASEQVFAEFFPDPVRALLTDACFWELRTERDDGPRLREAIGVSDAILTTWLSPSLHAAIAGAARPKLVAFLGSPAGERAREIGNAAVGSVTRFFGGQPLESVSFEMLAQIT
jgi:hypothetical protein